MKRVTLKSFISMLFIVCVLTVVYIALTEQWTFESALIGFAISSVALVLTQLVRSEERRVGKEC